MQKPTLHINLMCGFAKHEKAHLMTSDIEETAYHNPNLTFLCRVAEMIESVDSADKMPARFRRPLQIADSDTIEFEKVLPSPPAEAFPSPL